MATPASTVSPRPPLQAETPPSSRVDDSPCMHVAKTIMTLAIPVIVVVGVAITCFFLPMVSASLLCVGAIAITAMAVCLLDCLNPVVVAPSPRFLSVYAAPSRPWVFTRIFPQAQRHPSGHVVVGGQGLYNSPAPSRWSATPRREAEVRIPVTTGRNSGLARTPAASRATGPNVQVGGGHTTQGSPGRVVARKRD